MQHRQEQLRLAVALAHLVPGARLDLTTAEGAVLRAGGDPSCDLDLCTLRRVVLASGHRSLPDPARYVTGIRIGGALEPDAAGVHRSWGPEGPVRWFATLVPVQRVAALLAALPATSTAERAVGAGLRPDPCLGVTVVRLTVDPHLVPGLSAEPALDRMALAAHGRCLAEELVAETDQPRADGSSGLAH